MSRFITTGSTLAFAGTIPNNFTEDDNSSTGYPSAGVSWSTVGEVEQMSETGETLNFVETVDLASGRVVRIATRVDGGQITVTCFNDPTTAINQSVLKGRAKPGLIRDAAGTDTLFRIVEASVSDGGIGRTIYWRGTVGDFIEGVRGTDGVQMLTFIININTAKTEVAA